MLLSSFFLYWKHLHFELGRMSKNQSKNTCNANICKKNIHNSVANLNPF